MFFNSSQHFFLPAKLICLFMGLSYATHTNMSSAFLVFPHQLFEYNLRLEKDVHFFLIEDGLFFRQYKFHQQKLVLHRASMRYYFDLLETKGFQVTYLSFLEAPTMDAALERVQSGNHPEIRYRDVTDDWLEQRIHRSAKKLGITVKERPSPMFLSDKDYLQEFFSEKKNFHMADFYMAQRKRLNILMDGKKPAGGKWNYDAENRKKLPRKIILPVPWFPKTNQYVEEAVNYVQKHFPGNYGQASDFRYAVTHDHAQRCLENFVEQRLNQFGVYEDAIAENHSFLFHSVLTPYLNTGLLTPDKVVETVLQYQETIPLNSMEGFIRQVIGWREYMRAIYIFKGRKDRTNNFFDHQRTIPAAFWKATTAILPVDNTIGKALNNAYSHHIERLMVMGNFMMLCEFSPDEIYRWFMEMYIDAYDWVMVPNVYAMSQYAGGGTTTTKPYISSSNYILKMSDYKKGEWSAVWDALYWRFIHKHAAFFNSNPRLSVMVLHLNKMNKEKIKDYYTIAENYLNKLGQ